MYLPEKVVCLFFLESDIALEGFLGGSVVENQPANARDVGLIPGLGRSPGEENRNPLQNACLGNPIERGTWWATVELESQTQFRD